MVKTFTVKLLKIGIVSLALIILVLFLIYQNSKINILENRLSKIESSQSFFTANFSESLFQDSLKIRENISISSEILSLQEELNKYKQTQKDDEIKIDDVFNLLDILNQKISRNNEVGLELPDLTEIKKTWGEYLISKNFNSISSEISIQITSLDGQYSEYMKKLQQQVQASGYSYQSIDTDRGKFNIHLIKVAMSEVKVKTVSASSGSCKDNCDTKSLSDYVSENGGFAGINGSYFCPPDYSSCSGKVNSTDFGIYDSNEAKWEHKDALSWSKTGLITFKGGNSSFYKKSSDYDGGSVSAGISNYPTLVYDGEVVVKDDDLSSYQKDVKGSRGAIGVGGENIYLVIINNATVKDAAYVMRALGVKHALNLDGGGSSAMYTGGKYVAGPGRSLPNAIILVK